MSFNESNTVEQMILDAIAKRPSTEPLFLREEPQPYAESIGNELRPTHWDYIPGPQIPRKLDEVMVLPWLREALIRLNPEIAAQPDRADEVIYNLRACILSVSRER